MKISRTKKTKAYIPKTEEEKEQVRIKEFLDMCAPSVLKFYPDYYICGSSFRSTWVVREYPTDTEEQALLRHYVKSLHQTRHTGGRKKNHFQRSQ